MDTTTLNASPGPARTRVLELHREGMNPRQIANAMGISTQRVYQHLTALRAQGLIK